MGFNTARKQIETTNLAGGHAFEVRDQRFVLYSMVAANLITDKFYQDSGANLRELRRVIALVDPIFVTKLAIYARTNLGLRSAPVVLMIELARIHNGTSLVSTGLARVIQRADEITEALAYYKVANEHRDLKKISKQVSKGVAASFQNFDEYQFAKYKKSNSEITLRDAMFLTHPKPTTPEQAELFKKIAGDTLQTPETWEVAKSADGGKNSRKVWEEMIDSRKMGYMATLRNLRNFIIDGISEEHIDKVCAYLTNEKAIAGSRQFPFRFYTAYRELNQLGGGVLRVNVSRLKKLIDAVSVAGIQSLKNLTMLDQNDSVISVVDCSGSMRKPISTMSSVNANEIAMFYGSVMSHLNPNCVLSYFGTNFIVEQNVLINPFTNATRDKSSQTQHETNAHLVFEGLERNNCKVDKIFIWSDMQFWNSDNTLCLNGNKVAETFNSRWKQYLRFSPNTKLYLIDLAGYGKGTPVTMSNNVTYMVGFTPDTFKIVSDVGKGNAIIDEINEVSL